MDASEVCRVLRANGMVFFSGVACSLLAPLIEAISADAAFTYIPAPRENLALGLSSGAWLGGSPAGVVMQNSGLGHVINALVSYNLIYKIPVLLIIGWRGYDTLDAPEHLLMGPATTELLNVIGVPYRIVETSSDISDMLQLAQQSSSPVALLVKPGVIR